MYVGNLSHDVTEADLKQEFEVFGQVSTVSIIRDKFNGHSRGFGFVEMSSTPEAQKAVTLLNGKELKQQSLRVSEARPRKESSQDNGGYGQRY
jgi:RNA recognition motif-containing protein